MKAGLPLILFLGLGLLGLGQAFSTLGYEAGWRFWNVPTVTPAFADLRVVSGGAESFRRGLDPMVQNPGDPWARPMNYPRIWQGLFRLGLDLRHTVAIGLLQAVLFFAGVLVFLPRAGWGTAFLLFLGVFSPAVMLGLERGNTDLLMFFLLALAIAMGRRRSVFALLLIWLGFALKLYPLFGAALLINQRPSRFAVLMGLTFVTAAAYLATQYHDLFLIRLGTPYNSSISYGRNVFWMEMDTLSPGQGSWPRLVTYGLLVVTLLCGLAGLLRQTRPPLPGTPEGEREIDAFRVGAAVFLGTFLLGNNYNYRLMFMLFAIPQLASWSRHRGGGVAWVSRWALIAVFLALWYLAVIHWNNRLAWGPWVHFLLDQTAQWTLLMALAHLLCASLPDWAADPPRGAWRRVRARVAGIGAKTGPVSPTPVAGYPG